MATPSPRVYALAWVFQAIVDMFLVTVLVSESSGWALITHWRDAFNNTRHLVMQSANMLVFSILRLSQDHDAFQDILEVVIYEGMVTLMNEPGFVSCTYIVWF